jgi:hypothetical protein
LKKIKYGKAHKKTPVLKGQDAKKFISNMKSSVSKRFSVAERDRIKANFNKIRAISKV